MVAIDDIQLPVFLGTTTAYARAHSSRGHVIEFCDVQGRVVGRVTCGNFRVEENTKGIEDDGLMRASGLKFDDVDGRKSR